MRRTPLVVGAAVIALGAVLVALASNSHSSSSSSFSATTSSTSTTIAPHYPLAPLTGLPDPGGAARQRPALTIKIENTPEALPQWGVTQADVVYEEIVNGGITRLAAVFNSQAPDKVGPVRSVRPTDTQIVYPLGGIFAFSGGAQYALNSIATAPVTLVDESSAGTAMFRDLTRVAPHNLYAVPPALFAFHATPVPPPSLFHYTTSSPRGATRATRVTVPFPSIYSVTWTWNTTTKSWDRTLFGQSDVTGTGQRESPQNVVVMSVNYVNGVGTMSSYADLQGSGPAWIFRDGREILGTWSHSSLASPIEYHDATGATINLTPGQTWVELLNTGVTPDVTK